ncbi:putative cyclase [Rubrobacter xylanophilus DSM 9941]|uniref:Putative cyclase n=1 Tax=Rubrobacter xylanophilus (strain DSM 9941 / JCM 11954 / NBRC 16129 / PRD-1) TaxID=266117 RepID=Q1ASR5_RUBXD|nr:cyclase family protein [Rubrobacter xylanophilus]ABG05563.1 putative cyclase [Rubrobacter xylanophilus DSM 9941]
MEERQEIVHLPGGRFRLVDLSRPLGPTESEPSPPRLRRITHQEGAALWRQLFGIPEAALPGGLGFAGEYVEASTHASTHVDAPFHYAPFSAGERARTVDEVPLSWFLGPAVVLDVSDLPDGFMIPAEEIEGRLEGMGHVLSPGEAVLFRTGAGACWGAGEFFERGCGLGREAVLYLVERGVRLVGTDAWSLDRPYPLIGAEWRRRRDPSLLWPAHFAGAEREYCQVEKLANLEQLPAVGSTLVCFPVKVEKGSGAWARAVGLVPAEEGPG